MRDLVYYVASSIDGFIADSDGDFSCFPLDPQTLDALFARYPETCPEHLRGVLGVTGEARRFDTVLMGRQTHEPSVQAGLDGGAYPRLRQIVVTHRELPSTAGIEVMAGDTAQRVAELKTESGRDIWLCGGGDLASQLVELIDEIQVKINPVLLGTGIPLFRGLPGPREFRAVDVEPLPGGVVLATYRPTA